MAAENLESVLPTAVLQEVGKVLVGQQIALAKAVDLPATFQGHPHFPLVRLSAMN